MVTYKPRFNFQAAVYLILRDGDKVLLMRRCNAEWMDGMYILPAGHLDGNETAPAAASREMKEELGINISPEDLRVVHVMHRKSNAGREYFDIFLEADKYIGKPKINEPEKCDDLNWFAVNKLPENTVSHVGLALELIGRGKHYSSVNFD